MTIGQARLLRIAAASVMTLVHFAWVLRIQNPPPILVYANYMLFSLIGLWAIHGLSNLPKFLLALLWSPLLALAAIVGAFALDGQFDRLISIDYRAGTVALVTLMFGSWVHFPVVALVLPKRSVDIGR